MESERRAALGRLSKHLNIGHTFGALLAHFLGCQEKSVFFSKSKVRGALLPLGPPPSVLRQNGGQIRSEGDGEP